MRYILLVATFLNFIICSDNFLFKNNTLDASIYEFNIGGFEITEDQNYNKIDVDSKGTTRLPGYPELPTYSFNYSVKSDREYVVEYIVNDYEIIENINLYPTQPMVTKDEEIGFIKNESVYSSNEIYPETNIVFDRMSLRGYELINIELIPFEYDFSTKQLKVFTNVDVVISEGQTRVSDTSVPRSEAFEAIYKNTVINPETYQDSRSFQTPSILYICGGSIESTSYFNSLVEWRKQQGYVVYSASLSDTGTSTTSIKNYIQNAYNNWENPPEYVCFIGDADGSVYVPTYTVYGGQGWSSASGEGDYPYSLLDGNDLMPELLLGRISVRSTSEFVTILNKIIGYEKNYSNDTNWLNNISLVGDPYDSGISTVITNEYIEQLVELHGGIDNIDTKYSGNNYDEWMRDAINNGTAYLNYRGFYGFSGFTSNDVNQLNNGYRLPFIATLTCGTGSFATETTSMTESLFRAGTTVSPKGAVAIVGTAQSYTHTAFNNIIDMGIFDGIFLHNSKTIGEAVIYGYLAMNEIYPQNPGDNVYLFNTWNSLLGDPLTHLWTSQPKQLTLQHDMMVINGSTNFQVVVTDVHSTPAENVKVTLLNSDYDLNGLFMSAKTDQNGVVNFILDDYSNETVLVTAIGQNYLPKESEFFISNALPELNLIEGTISIDDSGNNDGILNPGESANLSFSILNNSNEALSNLNIELSTTEDYVVIDGEASQISSLQAGEQVVVSGFNVSIPNNIDDTENPDFQIRIFSNSDDLLWSYNLPIDFRSGSIISSYIVNSDNNNNGMLERGENAELYLQLENNGSIVLENLTAQVNYVGNELSFSSNQFSFNDINVGQSSNSSNAIDVVVDQNIINGSIVSIPITITTSNGYTDDYVFTLQLGQVSIGDPLGPDMHGYYIYDMNDTDYELAPDYDWIEIDPDYGGDGSEVDVNDNGDNGDDVTTVNLPFTFTFYGQDYDQVSICSNGWISFGETDMRSFRNYTLPGPGGPSPIVAVFWDDLKTTNGGEIYQYYDAEEDIFIIEWSNLRTFFSNSVETFQVILYNTGWQTPTGDDEIKIQFKEFNNTSIGDYPVGNYDGAVIHGQYCTVGIENHLMNDGLQYTFNNVYPTAAMPLSDETALFITTRGSALFAQPEPTYSTNEFLFNMPMNNTDTDELVISNTGEPGSILVYNAAVSPFPAETDQIDGFGYAWQSSANSLSNFDWIDISDNNEVLSFPSNDEGTLIDLGFDFTFYGDMYSQCIINPNGWIGFEEDNDGWNNQSILDEESPRSAIFAFWDDLNPANSNNEVGSGEVKYHVNEERVVIWYDQVVHWTSLERVYDFQVVLYPSGLIDINYREMQGDIDSATIGIVNSDGSYSLEVVYNSNFVEDDLSLKFDTVPSWMSLDLIAGNSTQIAHNSSAIYNVNVSAQDLMNGTYVGYIVVSTNASIESDVIPVNLYVSDSSMLGDINQDEIIDVLDTVRMVSIIMGDYTPNTLESLLADINQDGQINVQDVVLIVNIILSD